MVNHFFLNQLRVFHSRDSYYRFFEAFIVPDKYFQSASIAFETSWVAKCWPPKSVQGYQAFSDKTFQDYLSSRGIKFISGPSRRHHKNTLEPKHGIIRRIFLRFISASPDSSPSLLAFQAVSISNDLHGSETLFVYKISKGFTKPLSTDFEWKPKPSELITARDEVFVKRKLNLILRSHATEDPVVHPGDLVQVFFQTRKQREINGSLLVLF